MSDWHQIQIAYLNGLRLGRIEAKLDRVIANQEDRSPTSSSTWRQIVEAIPILELAIDLAKKVPWGLVAFGLMTLWQIAVPIVRRLVGLG